MSRSTFEGNTASLESGGLHADNFANLDVTGTSFVRNTAIAGGLRQNVGQPLVQSLPSFLLCYV